MNDLDQNPRAWNTFSWKTEKCGGEQSQAQVSCLDTTGTLNWASIERVLG